MSALEFDSGSQIPTKMKIGYHSDPDFPLYLQRNEKSPTLKSGSQNIWKKICQARSVVMLMLWNLSYA